ncbi:MBL fold metallo-hydrolase [Candidatus Bipolaricaulota bacterium]
MTNLRIVAASFIIALVGALSASATTITLAAGSGYIFRDGDLAVAIDALTAYGTTEAMQELMQTAEFPYDLDVILVTHSDFDHFDAALVAANMQTQTSSLLVGPTDVVTAVRDLLPEVQESRFLVATRQTGQPIVTDWDELQLIPFSFPHPPNGSRPNLGYVFTIGTITLFHPGDLDYNQAEQLFESYELGTRAIDIAFIPAFMFMDTGLFDTIGNLNARCLIPTHTLPLHLTRDCQRTILHFASVLCFQQLLQEIEYTTEIACEAAT